MPSIKVKNIAFDDNPPFRKLRNMKIEFADRITVIAGHNGIGKSTIMALVANNSGITSSAIHKTLFGKAFQANLFEIAYLDYASEYLTPKQAGCLPEPKIQYRVNSNELVTKACSITGRSNSKKLRVVARSVPNRPFKSEDGSVVFKGDAKIPLPTIYLGMTRMFPIGEANPKWVVRSQDKSLAQEEREFISTFINSVVVGSRSQPSTITLSIKGTGKLAKHPEYTFDTRSVSLGQDSLSAIATALASFQKLKRTWPQYPGGLLIIDEIDAGLHPHAQGKLIAALKSAARKLQLQIVATTHSTHTVKAVHPDGDGNANAPDSVIYLMDTAQPWHAADLSLQEVLNDMDLVPPAHPPKVKARDLPVYFEDEEALFVFDKLVPPGRKRSLGRTHRVSLKGIALGVGCNSLVGLSKRDPHFKSTLILVDADTSIKGSANDVDHVVKLPGGKDAKGNGLSPERTLHAYLVALTETPADHHAAWKMLKRQRLSVDQLREHLLDGAWNLANRESAKSWWKDKKEHIENWKLYELWATQNTEAVEAFSVSLEVALERVAKRLN